jgi:CBS domain-containing protein
MASTVRDVMTHDCACIGEGESVLEAARQLASRNIGSMPICGDDDRLKGMVTDRDIVVKVVSEGRDPASVTAGDLAQGEIVTVDVDASVEDALNTMSERQIRRLPVIENQRLVGVVAQADLARSLPDAQVGELVGAISAG